MLLFVSISYLPSHDFASPLYIYFRSMTFLSCCWMKRRSLSGRSVSACLDNQLVDRFLLIIIISSGEDSPDDRPIKTQSYPNHQQTDRQTDTVIKSRDKKVCFLRLLFLSPPTTRRSKDTLFVSAIFGIHTINPHGWDK